MNIQETFDYVFTHKGITVEISNLSMIEYEKLFPEYAINFLYDKIRKVVDSKIPEFESLEWGSRITPIVEIGGTNIKFGMEMRKDWERSVAIVFNLLDKSKYKYLSHEEKLTEVKEICKTEGMELNAAYYRFDPEPGFEDWGMGYSFHEDGKIYDCFESITVG